MYSCVSSYVISSGGDILWSSINLAKIPKRRRYWWQHRSQTRAYTQYKYATYMRAMQHSSNVNPLLWANSNVVGLHFAKITSMHRSSSNEEGKNLQPTSMLKPYYKYAISVPSLRGRRDSDALKDAPRMSVRCYALTHSKIITPICHFQLPLLINTIMEIEVTRIAWYVCPVSA